MLTVFSSDRTAPGNELVKLDSWHSRLPHGSGGASCMEVVVTVCIIRLSQDNRLIMEISITRPRTINFDHKEFEPTARIRCLVGLGCLPLPGWHKPKTRLTTGSRAGCSTD
jgi:hypothetical protein